MCERYKVNTNVHGAGQARDGDEQVPVGVLLSPGEVFAHLHHVPVHAVACTLH